MGAKRPSNKLHCEGTLVHAYRQTSQLYDWIGPVGRFSENVCHVSPVICLVSPYTFQITLTLTAIAKNPLAANSSTKPNHWSSEHSRMIWKDQKINRYLLLAGNFWPFEAKIKNFKTTSLSSDRHADIATHRKIRPKGYKQGDLVFFVVVINVFLLKLNIPIRHLWYYYKKSVINS